MEDQPEVPFATFGAHLASKDGKHFALELTLSN